MEWGEALRLVHILRADPSSQLVAAVEGWDHPLSREGLMLADLIDVQQRAIFKKPPPYRRPFKPEDSTRKRRGNAAGRTPGQVVEILRRFGHGVTPSSTT